MFIKYDEYDLLELFLREPISIADDPAAGELMYVYEDDKRFDLIMTISTYGKTCDLSITYHDLVVFTGEFRNVTAIDKKGNHMLISINDEQKLKVKFDVQVGIELL